MKTTYLTSVTTRLNPFAHHAKIPRMFLSLLPPDARSKGMAVTITQRPRANVDPSTLELGFKDGKTMKFAFRDSVEGDQMEQLKLKDVVEEVERHTRFLKRKQELSG